MVGIKEKDVGQRICPINSQIGFIQNCDFSCHVNVIVDGFFTDAATVLILPPEHPIILD